MAASSNMRFLPLALLVLGAACATPDSAVPRRAASEELPRKAAREALFDQVVGRTEPAFLTVATIDGEAIYMTELFGAWMHVDSQGVRELLERLVSARLVQIEAERLGLALPPDLLASEYRIALDDMQAELQLSQPGMELDEWIASGLGLDPVPYRERLREDVRRRLLAERVVRSFIYSQPWAEARVIVVEKRSEAETALERLAAGEPFGPLAAELSLDLSGKYGGRVPPILRNESALSRLAFSLAAGAVGGPIFESGRWMVLGLDTHHQALLGLWDATGESIEASLTSQPIEDPEYWMWKAEMTLLHPVDFGPLLDLLERGAPGRQGACIESPAAPSSAP